MDILKSGISVKDALQMIINSITPLNDETIPIIEAQKRILFEDVISSINIPPYNNSAMDGYAVISEETLQASNESPVRLSIIDEIQAGGDFIGKNLKKNCAIRIMTGAPIPHGADSIIPVEDTKEDNNDVYIYKSVKKYENIRFAGEDIPEGQVVLHKGDVLNSADIGLLVSLNYTTVKVYKRPEVAIISTGDEIVDIGQIINPGQIKNSSAYTLYSEILKYNAIPRYLGIAKDTKEDLTAKLTKALEYDIILTTGGVSMGKYDFVKDVINQLHMHIKFEKVKMKPGRPLVFGTNERKIFFGLPGNPVSTMVCFMQFVRPAILKMMNANKIDKPIINALLDEEINKKPGRIHFIRGHFSIKDGNMHVVTTGSQGSGILKSMSKANCFIILPEDISTIYPGEKVSIQLINHEEI